MNLEKAVKNRLNYYKFLKTKLEASQTKSALISLRNQFMQDQKRMNYQNEYDRLRGELSRSNLQGVTVEKLKDRQNVLEKLGAEAVRSTSMLSSESSDLSPKRLAKATSATQTRPTNAKDQVDWLIFNQNASYWEARDAEHGFKPSDQELDFNLRGSNFPIPRGGKFTGTKEQKQMMKKKIKNMIDNNKWVRL